MDNESSGANTVLIVLLIIIVVAGLVWFLAARRGASAPAAPANNPGVDLKVELPDGNGTGMPSAPGGSMNSGAGAVSE